MPKFLTAFFGNKKISNDEAEELKKLIDSYKEDRKRVRDFYHKYQDGTSTKVFVDYFDL